MTSHLMKCCPREAGTDNFSHLEIEKHFKVLQQAIALAGKEVEALTRDQRALTDCLRLEAETLRRCLQRLRILQPIGQEYDWR